MKNQLDLIISLSALIIALVIAGYFHNTARKPPAKMTVAPINLTPVKLPNVNIEMTNGVAAGNQENQSSGGGGGGGRLGRGG